MRSLPAVLFGGALLVVALSTPLLLGSGPAHAQDDPVTEFIVRADSLATAGGDEAMAPYVKERGVLVGALVDQLLDVAFEIGQDGDTDAEAENVDFAERVARIYQEQGGTSVPVELIEAYRGWTPEQRATRAEAMANEAEATELRAAGDYDAAVTALEAARSLYEEIGDARSIAVVWGSLGVVHWYRGDMEAVTASYEQALKARRAVEDNILVGRTLNGLGSVNYRARHLDAAIEYYDQAKAIRESTGDLAGLGSTLTYLGHSYTDLGELERGREYYEAAIPILEQTGRQAQRMELLSGLAFLDVELGDNESAIERSREAVELAQQIEDPLEAKLRLDLAMFLRERGLLREAMAEQDRVEAILVESPDPVQSIRLYSERGWVLYLLGDTDASRESTLQSVRLARENNEPIELANSLASLARLYCRLDAYDRALASIAQAKEAAAEVQDQWLHRRIAMEEAWTVLAAGDPDTAVELLTQIRDDDAARGANTDLAVAELELGLCLARADRDDDARHAFRRSQALLSETGQDDRVWMAVQGIGDSFETSDPDSAYYYYQLALDDIEAQRTQLGGAFELSGFLGTGRGHTYEGIVWYYAGLALEDPRSPWSERAFAVAERARGRGLLEIMGAGQESATPLATLADIQDALDKHTAVIEYALGDSASYAWTIRHNKVTLVELPTRDELSLPIDRLREALAQPGHGDATLRALSRSLFRQLIEPLAHSLGGAKRLVIVPDGILYELPFELLLTMDPPEGWAWSKLDWLGSEWSTVYAPSSTLYLHLQRQAALEIDYPLEMLAVARTDFTSLPPRDGVGELSPLPHSEHEVATVSALLTSGLSEVLVDANATETRVKQDWTDRQPRIVHLATHGLVDPVEPERSCVVLTADVDGVDDGYLEAAEIREMNVNSALVVLSACETARGRIQQGEGVVGISRDLLAAGSRGVVASLWPVSDQSTSELMASFYREMLDDKKPAAVSLQKARLALIADPEYAHPFHWAAFVLVGSERLPW